MSPNPSPELRELRQWHHDEAVKCEDRAKVCPSTTECAKQMALAKKHRGFIEALDPLFLADDKVKA